MAYSPFDEISKMHERMDELFKKMFRSERLSIDSDHSRELAAGIRTPATDLKETDKMVIANFEMPGIPKENIELNVTDTSLEVKGKRNVEKELKKKGIYTYESSASEFYRRIPLPTEIIASKAIASFKDGLLHVEIPKAKELEHQKPKRILIK